MVDAKVKARDIGLDVKSPEKECNDIKCPFHGTLPVRGRVFEGVVTSTSTKNTATVQWEHFNYYPKYERLARMNSKVAAQSPSCLDVSKGNKVKIAECRPLSKTKKFVVVEVIE